MRPRLHVWLAMLVLSACGPSILVTRPSTACPTPTEPQDQAVVILMDKFAAAEANCVSAQQVTTLDSNDPSRSTIACVYGKVLRRVDQPTHTRLFLSAIPHPFYFRLPAGVAVREGDCIKATGIVWRDEGDTPFIAPSALQGCD
jgi:hypothetical protein